MLYFGCQLRAYKIQEGTKIIMEDFRNELEELLARVKNENARLCASLCDEVYLTDYNPRGNIWTDALQSALDEHERVIIPPSSEPYIIDNSIIIPSGRHIIALDGATIRLFDGVRVLMMRNSNTSDGTHLPISTPRNENITIEGGVWEDWCTRRLGYGNSGMYDTERSFFGVSTYMLLENIDHLTLRNMTFKNCGGFAVQIGEASNIVIEKIRFIDCFADGLHINGNVESVYISDVSGEVGDDLVAFNMFDWQDSSINFGPCKNVICEGLELSPQSHYKALRIEPGVYTFDNGESVDCSLTNAIFRRVSGINTFKLYCQTPPYSPKAEPERAGVGSGDNILFEDIKIDLDTPIDKLDEYMNSDPIKGTFAGFELGLNAKRIYLKNISIVLHRDKYPLSYLACIGPKSARFSDGVEVFDPYFSSRVDELYLEGITINGERPSDITPYLKEIEFDHLYDDIPSTGCGKFGKIIYK